MNKRHVGIGGSEDPPPAPNKGTPCTPGKRKTLKSRTPKTPLARKSSTMELSENDLELKIAATESPKKSERWPKEQIEKQK
jgi:hypothetical protein